MEASPAKRKESIFPGLLLVCSLAFFGGMAMVIATLGLLVFLLSGLGLISVEFTISAMTVVMTLSIFSGIWLAFKSGKEHYEERLMWRKILDDRD